MSDDETDDESQKTEDPTPRKLEEARKRGQVVNSREVTSWAVLFTITLVISSASGNLLSEGAEIMKNFLENSYTIPADPAGMKQAIYSLFSSIGALALFPLAAVALTGGFIAFLQTGPLLTTDPIKPDISKISPFRGFSRIFSIKSTVEFAKGILKITIVSTAIYFSLVPYFNNVDHFVGQDVIYALFDMKTILVKILITILSIMFFVAIGDYIFQWFQFMKQMRMTKQEIKEEYKQTEGDPYIKGKLRQLRLRKARQRMMQNVPKADVIITNPNHYAIALQYEMHKMMAPVMIAKGVDHIALKIKEIAKEHKIPIVENPVLARALYDSMEIDQTIPEKHFKAVAEVISYVFKLKGKVK